MREPAWRRVGNQPDYRFSLANERTFLAWVRTAPALLAGALALNQLAPGLAPAPARTVLCVLLAGAGGGLGLMAYRRWAAQEWAMRQGQELARFWMMLGVTVIVALIALTCAVLIVVMG